MESESKEQDQGNSNTMSESIDYHLPNDYGKYISGEWSVDKRMKLALKISSLRDDVAFLEFIISFQQENGRTPSLEELNENEFETAIISDWSVIDLYQDRVTEEELLESLRLKLIEEEKSLGEILVNDAVEMDESSFNDLVKKIKKYKKRRENFHFEYADPVLGKVALILRGFIEKENRLPNQKELFERVGFFLTDKQKRRIKKVFGLVGVLPRKKRSQGFGGPQR
jgi:hypothetical protein